MKGGDRKECFAGLGHMAPNALDDLGKRRDIGERQVEMAVIQEK